MRKITVSSRFIQHSSVGDPQKTTLAIVVVSNNTTYCISAGITIPVYRIQVEKIPENRRNDRQHNAAHDQPEILPIENVQITQ